MKRSWVRGVVSALAPVWIAACGGGGSGDPPAAGEDVDLGAGIVMTADGQILVDVPRWARPAAGPSEIDR